MGCLYEAVNTVNNKRYIGVTTRSLHKRKLEHISKSKEKKTPFQKAICKYGSDAFHWRVLRESNDNGYLYGLEKRYVGFLMHKKVRFYNAHPGGHGGSLPGENNPWWGKKHSAETIQKMKKSNKRPTAKLSVPDVLEIKYLIVDGQSEGSIASRFNVAQCNINMIANGLRWSHVPFPIAHG